MKKVILLSCLLYSVFNVNTVLAVSCGDTITTTTTLTHNPIHPITQGACCGSTTALIIVGGGTPITVDLNGFEIRCCSSVSTGIKLISNGSAKVTLKNGTVRNCGIGVDASGKKYTIQNMTATKNATEGFKTNSALSPALTRILLTGNIANNNGSNGFFNIAHKNTATSSVLFSKNSATGNGKNGFYNDGNRVKFQQNTSSVNDGNGFHNFTVAEFSSNIANRNQMNGFYANGSLAVYNNNTATNNQGAGIQIDSSNQSLNNNVTTDNKNYGILAVAGSASNTVNNSFSSGNCAGTLCTNGYSMPALDINELGSNIWTGNECESGNIFNNPLCP
ncbi:MAG: right-handed parallel beta-helix repeat-containing protein [Methylococcaceae bacterium]